MPGHRNRSFPEVVAFSLKKSMFAMFWAFLRRSNSRRRRATLCRPIRPSLPERPILPLLCRDCNLSTSPHRCRPKLNTRTRRWWVPVGMYIQQDVWFECKLGFTIECICLPLSPFPLPSSNFLPLSALSTFFVCFAFVTTFDWATFPKPITIGCSRTNEGKVRKEKPFFDEMLPTKSLRNQFDCKL